MIISVVAVKIWYLKNVQFLLGHPVCMCVRHFIWCLRPQHSVTKTTLTYLFMMCLYSGSTG